MAIKLSDAQIKVLVELNTNGVVPKGARAATLDKLESFGFIKADDNLGVLIKDGKAYPDGWLITDEGQKEIGVPVTDREATAKVAEFAPNGLSDVEDEAPFADGVERYQDDWAYWEKELAGFGETLNWSNTQVWDGLTAVEIREDMETARHISRQERRKLDRVTAKLVKKGVLV